MAYAKHSVNERTIARRLKEGRGKGRGADYMPWITIQDCPSIGRRHRILGAKTRRIHHLLSDLERDLFVNLDWAEAVVDIREQFPLDRDITRRLAKTAGISHPKDPSSKIDIVMTTDFLVDFEQRGKLFQHAYTVKYASDLEKHRTMEKFELERRYWAAQNVPYFIATEVELKNIFTTNLMWLRAPGTNSVTQSIPSEQHEYLETLLQAIMKAGQESLLQFCNKLDRHTGSKCGTALANMRHLLSIKAITVDLSTRLDAKRPMSDFAIRYAHNALEAVS